MRSCGGGGLRSGGFAEKGLLGGCFVETEMRSIYSIFILGSHPKSNNREDCNQVQVLHYTSAVDVKLYQRTSTSTRTLSQSITFRRRFEVQVCSCRQVEWRRDTG